MPKDQLGDVQKVSEQLADKNAGTRDWMSASYQHTADNASDRLSYGNVESRPWSEKEARDSWNRLNGEEETDPEDFGLTTKSFVEWSDIAREAGSAALHAAALSAAITAAPYITKVIAEQIKAGRIDAKTLVEGGEAILMSTGNAGLRASIAATIVGSCKAGHAGV